MSAAAWAVVENIVWAIIFAGCVFFLEGWAKAWAVVPIMFMNYRIRG